VVAPQHGQLLLFRRRWLNSAFQVWVSRVANLGTTAVTPTTQ